MRCPQVSVFANAEFPEIDLHGEVGFPAWCADYRPQVMVLQADRSAIRETGELNVIDHRDAVGASQAGQDANICGWTLVH